MPTLALIGDSHAQAIWPRVQRALASTEYSVVLLEANPGWSEASYRSRAPELPAQLKQAAPNVVVFGLGGNAQKTGEAYAEDVRWLVAAAKDAGAKRIIWYGPATSVASINLDAATRHERTADAQKILLPELGVEWYDSRPLTMTEHRSDGVHFTPAGYDRWANAFLGTLLNPPTGAMQSFLRVPKAAAISATVGISALLIVLALRLRGRL